MKTYINQLKLEKNIIVIHPGDIITAKNNSVISTLLGSCIAVCMRDERAGVSGMNHFLLPGTEQTDNYLSAAGRYGISSMENLINRLLHEGASKGRLRAKIFGGGNVVKHFTANIGKKNINFVKWFMKNEKIPIVGEDVGGEVARKIYFFTKDGTVLVENLVKKTREVMREEESYFKRAKKHLDDSDITVF